MSVLPPVVFRITFSHLRALPAAHSHCCCVTLPHSQLRASFPAVTLFFVCFVRRLSVSAALEAHLLQRYFAASRSHVVVHAAPSSRRLVRLPRCSAPPELCVAPPPLATLLAYLVPFHRPQLCLFSISSHFSPCFPDFLWFSLVFPGFLRVPPACPRFLLLSRVSTRFSGFLPVSLPFPPCHIVTSHHLTRRRFLFTVRQRLVWKWPRSSRWTWFYHALQLW